MGMGRSAEKKSKLTIRGDVAHGCLVVFEANLAALGVDGRATCTELDSLGRFWDLLGGTDKL